MDPDFGMGMHASNVVCVTKPGLYVDGTRPRDTRDFCRRYGIQLPDEEVQTAVETADEDSKMLDEVTAASLADD